MVRRISSTLVAVAALLFCLPGCGNGDPALTADVTEARLPDAGPADLGPDGGGESAAMLEDDGSLSLRAGGRELFRLEGVVLEAFQPEVSMLFGFFDFAKEEVTSVPLSMDLVEGQLRLLKGTEPVGAVETESKADGSVRVSLSLDMEGARAMRLTFACGPQDRFWGFGEQYNYVDFRGRSLPVWVQEQGVGRAEVPSSPFVGELTDSYFPMPYFLDPVAGRGFLLANTEYSRFTLCAEKEDEWTVEVWNGRQVNLVLFPGPTPAEVVEQLTAEVGRPQSAPPDWAFSGVWLAAQGGTDAVRQRVETALAAGVPVSAVWVQDWVGLRAFGADHFGVKYRWTHDEELYPGLGDFIDELGAQGIRFLGYFNPFIVPDYDQYETAVSQGFIVTRKNGLPYTFPIVTFEGGLLDVSSAAAGQWFRTYAQAAVELGMSGWMADFGEWLPFDAAIDEGEAESAHNLYPTAWHGLNRQVLDQAYPDGDFVLLTRSGYTGEQGVAQVVWAGDQEADFSAEDGLPTVVCAGLTAGLAGVPFFTHDVGGFSGGPRTKELLWRWTELGAFTPIMRTHDGLKKLENHHFDSDDETLAFFARFGRVHQALLPYFKLLATDALERGLPMIRHTVLVDPAWEESLTAHGQWMVGPDLLVAPVVEAGAQSTTVAVPEGQWVHLPSGDELDGRQVVEVTAPPGWPAAFMRKGAHFEVVNAVVQQFR